MAARRDRCRPMLPENIVTESDLQMKELLRKQIETDVTVESQLSQVKSFSKAQVITSATDSLTGQVSLAEFSRLLNEQQKVDELRQFGLTDEEISVKLQHADATTAQLQTNGIEGSPCLTQSNSHSKQLEVIESKIAAKTEQLSQPTTFAGAKLLSRHEMDLEKAVTRDRNSTKVFRCLVTDRSPASLDPDHPINHLDQIWKDVLSSTPTCRRRKRKRAAAAAAAVLTTATDTVSHENPTIAATDNIPENTAPTLVDHDDHIKSSIRENRTSSSSDHCKLTKGDIEPVPIEIIERYRLSTEQIRKLPRFQDYSPGTPTPTLYLKNLSPRVTEEDLISLFLRFEKPNSAPVVFRLLHGRMKGQAFVTFDSVETATAALNLVNGYDFRGKPIVIVYGKRTQAAGDADNGRTAKPISNCSELPRNE